MTKTNVEKNELTKSGFTVSPKTGTGNATLTITGSERTGRIDADPVTFTATLDKFPSVSKSFNVIQKGKKEFVTINSITIEADGGTQFITGKSNSKKLTFTIDSKYLESGEDYGYTASNDLGTISAANGSVLENDIGASEEYQYQWIVGILPNSTNKERQIPLTVTTEDGTIANYTIIQPASVFRYEMSSIHVDGIPASGGSISVTVDIEFYRNDSLYLTKNAVVPIVELASDYDFASVSGNVVTMQDRGVDVGEARFVTIGCTYKDDDMYSSVASGTMVMQEANAETSITYATPSVSLSVSDIPASGGKVSSGTVSYSQGRIQNYTSGATKALSALTSGGTVTYSAAVSADSLGTTVKTRSSIGTLTATVAMNGKSGSGSATVYQAANTASYGAVSVSVDTPVSIPAVGATYNIIPTMSQTVSYTSGSTRAGSVTASYAAKNTVTGFSINGNTVTVQQNLATSARNGYIVTVTVTGEGSKSASKEVTFNQVGAAPYLNVDPTTITFAADGSSSTFKIESNDSWTIS